MALQIWLPLVKDLRQQGVYTLDFINNNAVYSSTGGKLGGCYTFSSATISAEPPSTLKNNFSNAASIACWVKVSSSHSTIVQCITIGTVSTTVAQRYFGIWINSSGVPYGNVSNGSNYTQCSFDTAIKDNTWHHLCLTYSTGTINAYMDGVLKRTTTTSYVPNWANATIISIGGNSTQTFKQNDSMNDVRIYNHCLTEPEIKQISQGLVLLYQLCNHHLGQENLLSRADDLTLWNKESGITVEWDSSVNMYKMTDTSHTSLYYGIYQTVTLIANTTYTFSVEGKSVNQVLSFGFNTGTGWPQNGTNFTTTKQKKSITITIGDSNTTCKIYLFIKPVSDGTNYGYFNAPKLELGEIVTPWCPNAEDTTASYYGLNGSIEVDNSGFYNNGEKTGFFKYTSDTYKYAVSTKFDGTNSITSSRIYDKTNVAPEYTVATWVKAVGTPSTNGYFYKGLLDLYINVYNKLGYEYGTSSSNSSSTSVNLVLEGWNHIAATYKNGVLTIYINGESKAIVNYTTYPRYTTDILNYNSTFNGLMSDFRIYATALSIDDIKIIYQNRITIDPDGTIRGLEEHSTTPIDPATYPVIDVGQIGYAII